MIWQKLLYRIAPPGTSRAQLPDLIREAFRVYQVEGAKVVASRTYWTVRSHWRSWQKGRKGLSLGSYSYNQWINDNEPSADALGKQRRAWKQFGYQPMISIITPVFNPPVNVLIETIESVLAQTYGRWQLCLVDGGSDLIGIADTLAHYASTQTGVTVLTLARNLGISGNINQALPIVSGEYVTILDHDDLLAPNMLFEIVSAFQDDKEDTKSDADSKPDVVYFDEDKISADSTQRRQPWFKPDWSPNTLLSNNILMHCVYRRALLLEMNGFASATDGAQDLDLALRLSRRTNHILHIPKILYHWRQIEGSAALNANAKPWAYDAQKLSITSHLSEMGYSDASVSFPSLGQVRIQWPTRNASVSIIIPTKDNVDLLRSCLTSIFVQTDYPDYEIVLVDTGSTEAAVLSYYAELRHDDRVKIIDYAGYFNFSKANNLGVAHAQGDLLLFLNNDTEVLTASWLADMAGWAMRPDVGVVGAKLMRPDGTIQHAGLVMGIMGHGSHIFDGGFEGEYGLFGSPEWYRDYQAVTGACMMVRREVFDQVGGFDELYEIGFGDIDLCLRITDAGYGTIYTPYARMLHHEGGSRGLHIPRTDVVRATFQMLPRILDGDPYFNPNLSYLSRLPAFARPDTESRAERLLRVLHTFDLVPFDSPASALVKAKEDALPPLWPTCRPVNWDGGSNAICLVTHDLSMSGAPVVMAVLAEYLVSVGRQVRVISPHDGPLRARYEKMGIEVEHVHRLLDDVVVAADALSRGGSIVVVNTIHSWRVVHAARAFCLPVAYWLHESDFGVELADKNKGIAEALGGADAVVFPAQATMGKYTQFRRDNDYVTILNGLEHRPIEAEDGHASGISKAVGKVRVVQIGSIEQRKGQIFLAQAIQKLSPAVLEKVEFFLIGRTLDSGYRRSLDSLVRHSSNIHLLGELPREEALAWLASADIFVLSSMDEVLPVTVLEAMHYGKPIIATNVGGVGEIISHDVSGLLVSYGDVSGLSQAIARLCTEESSRERLGKQARDIFIQRFTQEQFGTAWNELLDSLFQNTSPTQLNSGQHPKPLKG